MMEKKNCVMFRDQWYMTLEDAAKYCGITKQAMYKHKGKFTTVNFAGVLLIEMEELKLFNNVRIYKSKLINKEKGGKDGTV